MKLGVDIYSLRHNDWNAFEHIEYASKIGLNVVHFSEMKPFESLEKSYLRDVKRSAGIIKDILGGNSRGVYRDIVVLNAAAAIIVSGLANDFESGLKMAAEAVDSGSAKACLEKLVKVSNS